MVYKFRTKVLSNIIINVPKQIASAVFCNTMTNF